MLNRRFLLAMAAAALLTVANQALAQPSLLALATDAPVINVAGRQRMLSQRLAKAALAEGAAAEGAAAVDDDRVARRAELRDTLALWTRSHRGLQEGDTDLGLPGENVPEVRAAFEALEPSFVAVRDAADGLIAGRGDAAAQRRAILAAERDTCRK